MVNPAIKKSFTKELLSGSFYHPEFPSPSCKTFFEFETRMIRGKIFLNPLLDYMKSGWKMELTWFKESLQIFSYGQDH